MLQKFTHKPTISLYMKLVAEFIESQMSTDKHYKVLDLPAGNGLFPSLFSKPNIEFVQADVNEEKSEYVYANLEEKLPFDDNQFDFSVCMEGVEHIISPAHLLKELVRVTKPGGTVVITLPNIANFYSRLQFLLTGTFYQFGDYSEARHPRGEMMDRGHISPMNIHHLNYLFSDNNATIKLVAGDRRKRMVLTPIYVFIYFLEMLFGYKKIEIPLRAKLSRSLVAAWEKDMA